MDVQGYLDHAGPAAFFALSVAASSLPCIPMTVINLAAGSLFGPWLGTLLFISSASLGALAPALLVRGSLRPWALQKFSQYEGKVKALNAALEREGPFKIVVLVRLSPAMPVAIASYILGMTDVSLMAFGLGTAAGLLPFSFIYVLAGAFGKDMLSGGGGHSGLQIAMMAVGAIATVALMWKIARIAQGALDAGAEPAPDRGPLQAGAAAEVE